eukprot:825920-Lingulodinium_polyedra.AAC.1
MLPFWACPGGNPCGRLCLGLPRLHSSHALSCVTSVRPWYCAVTRSSLAPCICIRFRSPPVRPAGMDTAWCP